MLAPLVVNLLISCILMMLAGWSYDILGNWIDEPSGGLLHGIVSHPPPKTD